MSRSLKVTENAALQRMYQGQTRLSDFLTEGEFASALMDARWRIIRVFTQAPATRNKKGVYGCIVGLDEQLASLAEFLHRNMSERARGKIFSVTDLPSEYSKYTKSVRESIAGRVRIEVFIRLLVQMREAGTLWRVNAEWWLPQSEIDVYTLLFRRARQAYRNESSWHGRPNGQRARFRRLRLAPGTSTGR